MANKIYVLAFLLLLVSCSKKEEPPINEKKEEEPSQPPPPQPPSESKSGITHELLSNYIVVEEFAVAPGYTDELGERPIIFVYAVESRGNFGYAVRLYDPVGWFHENAEENIYDANTKLAKIKTAKGYIELKEEENKSISVAKGLQFANADEGKKYVSKHIQIVKLAEGEYFNYTYKAIEGVNGHYKFNDKKWRYSAAPPPDADMTWFYNRLTSFIWFGQDAGTAKYDNRFIIIPKGNGWKGNHKDKDLLLVNVTKYKKGVEPVIICEKVN